MKSGGRGREGKRGSREKGRRGKGEKEYLLM